MISVILPTRGRPENVKRFCESFYKTVRGPVELIFRLDVDDLDTIAVCKGYKDAIQLVKPRIKDCGVMWNQGAAISKGDILLEAGDDAVFLTDGWDLKIAAEFKTVPDNIALVWGDDLHLHDEVCVHYFISRKMYELVGYLAPEGFPTWFHDTWWYDIMKSLGRHHYLPSVEIEHMHHLCGKTSVADYKDMIAETKKVGSNRRYRERIAEREYAIYKFQDYIDSYNRIQHV